MVTRKPLPASAVLSPGAAASTPWTPEKSTNDDDTIWGDNGGAQHQHQDGNTNLAPPSDLSAPRSGGPSSSFSSLGDESNIWADDVSALSTTVDGDLGGQAPPRALPPGDHGSSGAAISGPPPSKPETNPFKRKMSLSSMGSAASGQPAPPQHAPPPVPPVPVADFSQLSVNEPSTNPWHPALKENSTGVSSNAAATPPRLPEQDSTGGDNVWASSSAQPSRPPSPGLGAESPAVVSIPSEEESGGGWEEEPKKQPLRTAPIRAADGEILEDTHAWDDLRRLDKGKDVAAGGQAPPIPGKAPAGGDEWNLIDLEPAPRSLSRQSTWENFKDEDQAGKAASPSALEPATEEAPELPPRHSKELPPPPPRVVDESETYQIKNINWFDATAAKNPRTSPILVQNLNGPCPLVALVNALTLTTPADKTNTALVEALRSREQVSLGLLLGAVFDELMSERRVKPDVPLPDVTELYDFLKGLHTGMNVNPRFVPTREVVTAFKRTSLTHLHPTERTDLRIPGTFEHTKEMALYSTFSVPLIHGWLPSQGSDGDDDGGAAEALARQAASYEDTQNLLFREEELEAKLCDPDQGLTPDEQQLYQDVLTIKAFLSSSATQLTRFGLDVIKTAMKPGSVAILFRNDHFSTLYRHPQTLELLTLVTDAGYAGHAEVVWESLVDVSGESAEFFSGDFRLVGGAGAGHGHGHGRGDEVPDNWEDAADAQGLGSSNWTTVQSRRGRPQSNAARLSTNHPGGDTPLSPKHEQEDRDLALALQLQEEEDERARHERERRRRESMLSEQFIEQQGRGGINTVNGNGRGGPGIIPARSSSSSLPPAGPAPRRGAPLMSPAQPSAIRPSPASTNPHSAVGNIAPSRQRPPPTQAVRSLLPPVQTASSATGTATVRPRTHRPADNDEDDAPPSYEQAAKQMPYVPPAGHPSHHASRQGNSSSGGSESPRTGTTSAAAGSNIPRSTRRTSQGQGQGLRSPGAGAGSGRGTPAGNGSPGSGYRGRERDCVVM
ncbi:hypothetical protein B0J18DRAFT_480225 [Chaetomium sp. MPI-SDFR-AT-0129]|nr:hypothetical protein B0J18DRAFT_480225 [Chaetomium sp. MPI-SDFR-AT-0129]